MQKLFMPDADQATRLEVLRANADRIESGAYIKELGEEEKYQRREQLADESIKLRCIEEEKKEVIQEFKSRIDPVRKTIDCLLDEIKTGQAEKVGEQFLMANHTDGVMEYYDESGVFIRSRRLKPEEKQGRIVPLDNQRRAANGI